ncbi:hypothetical protein [Thiohalophilus sp.]|uniref:hypothetical protein n=1 Tax=Thiohalophilus sp. TaxID=3028392 RepID=UPI002ACEAD97|nr:hypothetical protein [Thiohalophilus sp.]MDZ7662411.1 hypothetical protein [Thiohalophilus sp.]
MSRSPGLEIPAQRKPGRQDFSLRPKKVDAWLDSLPKANLGETARLIYRTLNQTNRLQYPFMDRFRFLEQMREPVQYVTDSMRKHFLAMTFPLPEKNRRIAVATREIYAAMATGYKIAIEEMTRSHPLFQDKKLLASLLQRALTYTGRNLLTAYQIYAPCAPRTWQELHKLYAYAESRRLHKTVVSDDQQLATDKTTLQAEYLRLLLLALASPYQLRQGEILRIYHALERWARRLELRPLSVQPAGDTQTRFLVCLDQDTPPRPAAYAIIREKHRSRYRQLETETLTHLLQEEIRANEEVIATTLTSVDLARPDLSHDLMRRLLVAWGAETKRSFPRSPKQESVEVTIGLSATHRFLNQLARHQSDRDLFEHRARYESQEIKSINEPQHDVWDMIYTTDTTAFDSPGILPLVDTELARHDAPAFGDAEELASSDPAQHYRAGSWLILNESASGYCLEYHEAATTQAQVGEVVGIRHGHNGKTLKWGIGVIRWLKFAGIQAEDPTGKTVQMGIEMLNPAAAAVGIRPAVASNHPENYQRTLMLPEIRAMHQPATLITGPVPWRPGQHAVLNILGKELPVVLTHALQNTGLFAQFQFQSTAPDSSRDNAPHQDDALSEVWSSI